MSVIQLEREYFQLQADHGVGNPLWENWEWKTMKGNHYSYSGYSQRLYQKYPSLNRIEIIMDEVLQLWFPEKIGFRPLFVATTESGEKKYFNTERVVSYTSIDWPMIRSNEGDLQTWVTLKDGEWIKELVAK
jgi:hypothetical protein